MVCLWGRTVHCRFTWQDSHQLNLTSFQLHTSSWVPPKPPHLSFSFILSFTHSLSLSLYHSLSGFFDSLSICLSIFINFPISFLISVSNSVFFVSLYACLYHLPHLNCTYRASLSNLLLYICLKFYFILLCKRWYFLKRQILCISCHGNNMIAPPQCQQKQPGEVFSWMNSPDSGFKTNCVCQGPDTFSHCPTVYISEQYIFF